MHAFVLSYSVPNFVPYLCPLCRLQLIGSSAMTSQHPSHAESVHSTKKQPLAVSPKLHVQRSPTKETITIHFSALGKEEEEEEEELYMTTATASSAAQDDANIVTALEASEEMFEVVPIESATLVPEPPVLSPPARPHSNSSPAQSPSSHMSELKGSTSIASPSKSLSFPSSDKPFLSLVKSLSSDVESRDGIPSATAPTMRHRQIMKTLVKSLSSDTSQDPSSSSTHYRLPEPRLNLQLFKQLTQSRTPPVASTSTAGDSKTAPSSPLTSPDNRSFFKVEAKIEDTKRRLSEAISEPLQLLSKIMDEKSGSIVSGSIYRPKALSASATELSSMASANGHLESNNNYCIKEEECAELEAESPNSWASAPAETPVPPSSVDAKSPNKSSLLSMSALARQQEDEDFCILSNEDFETTDTEGDGADRTDDTGSQSRRHLSASSEPRSEEEDEAQPAPSVPHYTLIILTLLVYGCFVVPLPNYVGGMMLGVALGFFLAIGVVWLAGPKPSGSRYSSHHGKTWSLNQLDIKVPDIYKVSESLQL